MNGLIDRVADRCGSFIVSVAKDTGKIFDPSNHQTWLLLSTVVVVVGFLLLKSNR